MKKIKALILLTLLSACGPKYQTSYEILPPQTDAGRTCANSCLLSKTNCEQTCDLQQMTCRERARLDSQNDYVRYVAVQNASGRPVVREQRDFVRYYDCSATPCMSTCTNTYHICHTNCGGQVLEHRQCTAFCPEELTLPSISPKE